MHFEPENEPDQIPDPLAPTGRPRLVRSRSGRLIAPLVPRKVVLPEPMSRRAKILAVSGGVTFFGLLIVLFLQAKVSLDTPVKPYSSAGDAGYVIREVRGPGLKLP